MLISLGAGFLLVVGGSMTFMHFTTPKDNNALLVGFVIGLIAFGVFAVALLG